MHLQIVSIVFSLAKKMKVKEILFFNCYSLSINKENNTLISWEKNPDNLVLRHKQSLRHQIISSMYLNWHFETCQPVNGQTKTLCDKGLHNKEFCIVVVQSHKYKI